jgi:hypothetical protein
MFTDDKMNIYNNCPQIQNADKKCRRAAVCDALDGVKLPNIALVELRSVLFEVCRACMAENTKSKER